MKLQSLFAAAIGGVLLTGAIDANAQEISNEEKAESLKQDLLWILQDHNMFFASDLNPPATITRNFMQAPDADLLETCYTLALDGGLGVDFEHDNYEQIDSYYFAERQELSSTTFGLGNYYHTVADYLAAHPEMVDADNLDVPSPGKEVRIGCFNDAATATQARKDINIQLLGSHIQRLTRHVGRNIMTLMAQP